MLRSKELDIINKVEKTIKENNLIENNDKIVVAVSGGSDSMCLLNILMLFREKWSKKLNFEIVVAHVHHMLRKESDEELENVKNYCKNNNVEFYSKKIDVNKIAKEMKESVETTARRERYKYFKELMNNIGGNKIAVAHNLNDNVETVLMHFIRGAGINGLSGIQYKNGNIIRPLLDIKKQEINDFCQKRDIEYCLDKTNFETIYTRNKMRLDLIKKIEEEYNPNFLNNVARMSNILSEEEEYLKEISLKTLEKAIISETSNDILVNTEVLRNQSNCIRKRIIILLIQKITNRTDNIESIHVEYINNLILNNIKGKKFILLGKYKVEIIDKTKLEIKNTVNTACK